MDTRIKNLILSPLNLLYRYSPELALKVVFKLKNGYKLNLRNPVTYNAKLQWIKLYDKDPNMPICADKFAVRQYVKNRGCEEILNDLIWEGFDPLDIPFESLPNQFVIKVTHGSGFNIICTDKKKLSIPKTLRKLNNWLKAEFIPAYGEWFYGQIKPRIIIERFLSDEDGAVPSDYKVMCFHGQPKFIVVDTDRFINHKRNIYDVHWNLLEGYKMGFPNDIQLEKPKQLKLLLEYSRKLSSEFKHARIDLFVVDDRVYFGEITFTNGAGFDKITPHSFDVEMGDLIRLPSK